MERIYLDNGSATPINPRVLTFAQKYLGEVVGNPSSLHSEGLGGKQAVEDARERVAALINADEKGKLIFTSGATEANNLAIRGTALRNASKGKAVVASAIEHISVLNPMKDLAKQGFEMTLAPVDGTGLIDLGALEGLLTDATIVTSVMYANNEIGTIQPIEDVSTIVHEKGRYIHVDATATAGRIPIDVQRDGVDLLTLSGNALGGPPGVGALYVAPGVKLQTVLPGGGQEQGLRSGTENVFAIAGMGEAARLARDEMTKESKRLQGVRDALVKGILAIEDSYLTGHPEQRLPHHASFRFGRIEGESILLSMDMYGIAMATGSACTSRTLEASHVLLAIGLKHEEAHGSMVLTLGWSNTMAQVPAVVDAARGTVERLRNLSPL
ncbi:MAG: cysteine desulfurase family protein [Methanopyri archaeon]|jgi:cysteine desulfurase|nr:cysteine desulfurase family protein [Methanopyri archaeon]